MGLLKKQKFPLLLGPRNRNDMRENNRNDKRNFERRDGKKRDFKGKRDYRDRGLFFMRFPAFFSFFLAINGYFNVLCATK